MHGSTMKIVSDRSFRQIKSQFVSGNLTVFEIVWKNLATDDNIMFRGKDVISCLTTKARKQAHSHNI